MPTQNDNTLDPEDVAALIAAQQHLYGAGDPRAEQLYNYILKMGYGQRGMQGELLPNLDLSNPKGQGTYAMERDGKQIAVPYGQVQDAAAMGYGFANENSRAQYNRDFAAAPGRTGGPPMPMFFPQTNDEYEGEDELGQKSASLPAQLGEGIAKGAGTLARPVLDAGAAMINAPAGSVDEMLTPQTVAQGIGKYGTMAAAAVPAMASAPVATVGGLVGGTAAGAAGNIIGRVAGLNPNVTQLVTDAAMLGGGAGAGEGAEALSPKLGPVTSKLFPWAIDGPPEQMVTQAMRGSAGKNNVTWLQDLKTALPQMKAVESPNAPISGLEDAVQAAKTAKQNIWNQFEARLNAAGKTGATIDGDKIADAMKNSISPRAAQQNPALAARVEAKAAMYEGKQIPLAQAEEYLSGEQGVNNELATYYAKNKVNQRVARGDPEIAATLAEGDALRSQLMDKLDSVTGPGAAQLRKTYGALSNVQNVLEGRRLVALRQAQQSLPEQIGAAKGAGKIVKGLATSLVHPIAGMGDVAEGAENIAISRALKERNSTDALITRAMKKVQPAAPFPAAKQLPFNPLQLPAKSSAPLIPPAPDQMTGGERIAALMQMLRKNPQLALPARSNPIQLPPPS